MTRPRAASGGGAAAAADAVVVGAGPNGLVAAVRLARAGRRVLVLERREEPGGLAAAREFHPGYRAPGLLHDDGAFRPWIAADLDLDLGFRAEPPPVLAPAADGPGLLLDHDPQRARAEIEVFSRADAAGYARFREFCRRVAPFVRRLLDEPPPALAAGSLAELWQLAKRGLALRRLGRAEMTELIRVTPMCAADWLNEHFATELLSELLAGPAVVGTFLGPWSAGSAANLLFAEAARGRPIAGGPPAIVAALLAAAARHGVSLRTAAPVAAIRVRQGRVAGVTLASGEEIDAPVVAASCDPKQTFLGLLDPRHLPLALEQQLRAFRARGTAAKVHLALAGPLELRGRPGAALEAVRVGGGRLDALERAFDAVKYRRFSERPYLDVRVPTVAAPELAPPGHHVVSILVGFVPYDLDAGWTAARRDALGEAVLDTLAGCAPGLRERLVAREVLTPADLERGWALTSGHLHHGEHALDQLLWMRPAPAAARYRTPLPGLFLAGSGSHPGGGITGVPGYLAAGAILAAY